MSERYTYEVDNHGCVVVYDRQSHCEMHGYAAADELNRLAAQVATLRELVNECRDYFNATGGKPAHLAAAFDTALADTETTG